MITGRSEINYRKLHKASKYFLFVKIESVKLKKKLVSILSIFFKCMALISKNITI